MGESVSLIENNTDECIMFYEDIKYIKPTSFYKGFIEAEVLSDFDNSEIESSEILNYVSNDKKALFTLYAGPHHFTNDSAALILKFIEENPGVKLYLDTTSIVEQDQKIYTFFYDVLKDLNVNFELMNLNNIKAIKANNFYIVKNLVKNYNAPIIIYKTYSKYFYNKNINKKRKVYLSRKLVPSNFFHSSDNNSSIKDTIRINNEYKIEQFFYNNGFDIIQPELFETFYDQINYFSDVELLVSATTAGLFNSYFMEPGSTVVEFATPMLIVYQSKEDKKIKYDLELHHFFQLNS